MPRPRNTATPRSNAAGRPLDAARAQHLALAQSQKLRPDAASLSNPWAPVGPLNVQTAAYGLISGRVTSLAIDPNDTAGNTVCTVTSQYRDLSATGTVTVTVLTGVSVTKQSRFALVFLPALLALPWCMRRRSWSALAMAAFACILLIGSTGCGADRVTAVSGDGSGSGGSSGGTGTTTSYPTPSGTYAITAAATAAGVTHTVQLTLVVQ